MEREKVQCLLPRDIYFKILYDAYLITIKWFNYCHLPFYYKSSGSYNN